RPAPRRRRGGLPRAEHRRTRLHSLHVGHDRGGQRGAPAARGTPALLCASGRPGARKGVPIPHVALRHFTEWLLATHGFTRGGETFLNQAPFGFDLSLIDPFRALRARGNLLTTGP